MVWAPNSSAVPRTLELQNCQNWFSGRRPDRESASQVRRRPHPQGPPRQNIHYQPRDLQITVEAASEEAHATIEVRVFRYVFPELDYDLGRHWQHCRKSKSEDMLRKTITLLPGAPKASQFRFIAPGQKHTMDSQWLLVSLAPRGDAPVLLRRCSVTDADAK